jgi:peptidylprolyl isomerase
MAKARLRELTAAATAREVAAAQSGQVAALDAAKSQNRPGDVLVLETTTGRVRIKLRPDLAPRHVERVRRLVKEGFYDGLTFHRVIEGFMAQGGDPTGTGQGGSRYPHLTAEFNSEPYVRGSVGAARTSDPNSANSQFFICFDTSCSALTGQYTLWGMVIEGMAAVDAFPRGQPPTTPAKITKARIE